MFRIELFLDEMLTKVENAKLLLNKEVRLLTKWYIEKEYIAFYLLFVKNGEYF